MNLFARSIGGYISDWSAKKAGIRGRLWATWIVQSLEGICCIITGSITIGFDAPHEDSVGSAKIEAWTLLSEDPTRTRTNLPTGWVNLNATCHGKTSVDLTIDACDTLSTKYDEGLRHCLGVTNETLIFLRQTAPPDEGGPNLDCISNSNTIAQVMIMIVLFSLCVQAAEGLHYGVVPYVSRPALGVVSGMVGAGGNAGAVIAGNIFFLGEIRTDQGIINLGWMIIGVTALLFCVYFSGEGENAGGMLFKPGGLGSYDPQILKPPADFRGADVMDFSNVKEGTNGKKDEGVSSTTDSSI